MHMVRVRTDKFEYYISVSDYERLAKILNGKKDFSYEYIVGSTWCRVNIVDGSKEIAMVSWRGDSILIDKEIILKMLKYGIRRAYYEARSQMKYAAERIANIVKYFPEVLENGGRKD